MIKGLEGVVQIKDNIVIHGKGKEYDEKLEKLLDRLQNEGQTLRAKRCEFGAAETTWFGYIYNRDEMRTDTRKGRGTGERTKTKNKAVQTQEISRMPERTEECQAAFDKTKRLPSPEQARAQDNPGAWYMARMTKTTARKHIVEDRDHPDWEQIDWRHMEDVDHPIQEVGSKQHTTANLQLIRILRTIAQKQIVEGIGHPDWVVG